MEPIFTKTIPCPGVGILKMIPCSAARPRTEEYMSTPPGYDTSVTSSLQLHDFFYKKLVYKKQVLRFFRKFKILLRPKFSETLFFLKFLLSSFSLSFPPIFISFAGYPLAIRSNIPSQMKKDRDVQFNVILIRLGTTNHIKLARPNEKVSLVFPQDRQHMTSF